ncbi:uncharacterized protein V1510DRAFT_403781 [Dipodascopsis tothii]|uniref:uncharacterized protein n=1 Tax=Dipodascopsis tothii TaxID=44089 RepID=UPI0034CD41BA
MARKRSHADAGLLGTPVGDDDDGRFVPVWQQDARDERGRRRFHGAFTGGFSAGYFNSVGSKEGWTPSEFKSSRTARAEVKQFRPEDFMDDEDMAEQRAAERLDVARPSDLTAASGSKGVELLQKMGWKEGFGIGPARPTVVAGREVAMPPRNTAVLRVRPRVAGQGVGYGDAAAAAAAAAPAPATLRKKRAGAAVLLDEEEDEGLEIKPMRTLPARPKVKKDKARLSTHAFVGRGRARACFDGRPPLAGFELGDDGLAGAEMYAPPAVPADYVPGAFVRRDPAGPPAAVAAVPAPAAAAPVSTPAERGAALGERPLKGKSVFDFLTPEQRDRIAGATGKTNLPPARSEALEHARLENVVPSLDGARAEAALSERAFLPYADDPAKRGRYLAYLESQTGARAPETLAAPVHDGTMRRDAWLRELREFQRAGSLFKPLGGLMASRFTSAAPADAQPRAERDDVQAARMGMYGALTRSVAPWAPAPLLCKRFGVRAPAAEPEAPAPVAAPLSAAAVTDIMRDASGDASFSLPDVQPDHNAALEQDRAAPDLFTAIFGDD